MRVFFSAGEASGDAYGAEMLRRLRAAVSGTRAEAVGGRKLREAGASLVADSSSWGAMGVLESLRVAPKVKRGYDAARRALAQGEPGLLVPIDFGYMNVRLARRAKALGWKVLYFVPPGSWRRDKQGADLPGITDAIVTPFSWSAEILNRMGANAHWFGHPLKQMVAQRADDGRERRTIAVLPGSRGHEIALNLRAIVPAVSGLGFPLEAAVAPSVSAERFQQLWAEAGGDPAGVVPVVDDAYGVLRRARVAVVCSGTATLEAALCGCPSVVVYRGTAIMEIEYRLRRPKFDFIALPNILLGRAAVPELIQREARPTDIARELGAILAEGSPRERQLAAFAELDALLGPADALDRTVDLMRSLLT